MNNSCAPCSAGVGQSCGHCGGTTQCDGSCTKATPSDFGTVKEFSSDEEAFACCWIDYTKTFGGDCSPGYVFEDVNVTKTSGGGSCLVITQGSGTNCRVTMRFHNNGTEGARCRIAIKQKRVCDTGG
ncbi:MAG: hypothetical protein JNM17_40575 [Archangium sp.]|nr:hypothetical protein [Archangium sp.]